MNELEKEAAGVIESSPKAYRTTSLYLYNKIRKFKRKLFDSKMYHRFKDPFTFHQLTQKHGYPDKQVTSILGLNNLSDIKVVQGQIQQVMSNKEASEQQDVTIKSIIGQFKSLKKGTGSINNKVVQIAKLLAPLVKNHQNSSSQNLFCKDSTVVKGLKRLTKLPEEQQCSFKVIMK